MTHKLFKLTAAAAVVAATLLSATSCTSTQTYANSPENYASQLAGLRDSYHKALDKGDKTKAQQYEKQAQQLNKEIQQRCLNNSNFARKYHRAVRAANS